MKKMFKTKDEYCHVFDDKLVITKTTEIDDLVMDYAKSVNNVFKTLMVFFVFIPIFTALAFIFHNIGNYGISIYSGSFAIFFLSLAFYYMLFTSGSPKIEKRNIKKVKFQRRLFNNVIIIYYKDFGKIIKKRHLIIEDNQLDTVKNILLTERLIEEKDIELNGKKADISSYILTLIIILPSTFFFWINSSLNIQEKMTTYGILFITLSAILVFSIARLLFYSYYRKK